MQKIQRGTSNNAENPTRNFQKSYEKLPKIAQHPVSFFQKCKKSHE
jgi:hypothetical protein